MVKTRSEDTVIYSALSPKSTEMEVFYEQLHLFLQKKNEIDLSDRYNYILFGEDKPNYLDDFTFDYYKVSNELKRLEESNLHPSVAGGIFGAIPLFLVEFKKIGNKCFRLIIFIDRDSDKIPEHELPILFDLLDKLEVLSLFIDIIGDT